MEKRRENNRKQEKRTGNNINLMISCYLMSVEHAEKQIAYTKRSVSPLDQKLWTNFGIVRVMDGWMDGWMDL